MNRVPKLRFKEFCNELINNYFFEFGDIKIGLTHTPTYVENGKIFLSSKNISKGYIDFEDVQYIAEEEFKTMPESTKPKKGDILFTRVGSNLGNPIILEEEKECAIFVSLGIFRVNDKANNYYIKHWMNTNYFWNQVEKKVAGGAKNNLNTTWLKEFKINIPTLQEQQKIADFLSSVDKKISITEEKLDLFKDYKKGIMQKIFKQELRFKDSNGNDYPEWEEKILGKIIIKNKEKNKENKYNLVQSISNKYGFVNQDEYFEDRRVASQDLKNYYVAKNKLFAYNPSRINVGSLAYKEDSNISVISPLYVSFYSNKEYLIDKFLLNWLFSLPFIKQMSCSFEGSVRNNLSFETLSNFIIQLPCLEEQQKIADFLSSIDNKIDNLAAKLEDLKEFKKGLLQQMFV